MLTARTDQKVLGYLGRSLSLELSAVQQYSTQARLLSAWGLSGPAARLRAEAEEEMSHVDRIIERMLALGVAPNASQLRPVRLGQSLTELLTVNMIFEQELISLYENAARHCSRVSSHDDRMFFEGLLEDERNHYRELLEWIQQLQGNPTPRGAG